MPPLAFGVYFWQLNYVEMNGAFFFLKLYFIKNILYFTSAINHIKITNKVIIPFIFNFKSSFFFPGSSFPEILSSNLDQYMILGHCLSSKVVGKKTQASIVAM